jgi:iron complex outermembrane recepter protein
LEFQHSVTFADVHRLVWGASYRATAEVSHSAPVFGFDPENVRQVLAGVFAQGTFAVTPDVSLIGGTKLERNSYTGEEWEPNVRFQWKAGPESMLWGAVSRAVRTPSRLDRSLRQPSMPPSIFLGSNNFTRETVVAYELGYRTQVTAQITAAVSVFYNRYADIRSLQSTPLSFVPLVLANDLEGDTYGLEFTTTFQPAPWWRLTGAYTLLEEDIHVRRGGTDVNNARNETSDPKHQLLLRSSMTLLRRWSVDTAFRWVDTLYNNVSGQSGTVPSYAELDLRLGWQFNARWELSIVGQNLLHDQHPEFGAARPDRVEVQRSLFAKLAWRF